MNMMRALADDIAFDLANELRRRKAFLALAEARDPPMLVDQIDQEAFSHQGDVEVSPTLQQQVLLQRLQQVENTLKVLARQIRKGQMEPDSDSKNGEEGSKYQNVDTLLKYVDGPGAEGGVKLVIMNFND